MTTMSPEKTIYFVRHGESIDNSAPVFQASESPLSAKGKEQAEKIAKRVNELSFQALISSTLPRARETAEIIAKATKVRPEYSKFFVERIKPTAINGKPWDDEAANKLWREWNNSLHTPGVRAENGENFEDILTRADTALALLFERKEDSILVVTHGYFLRSMIARILFGEQITGEQFEHFHKVVAVANTGITVIQHRAAFEESAKWRLQTLNDYAHLAEA